MKVTTGYLTGVETVDGAVCYQQQAPLQTGGAGRPWLRLGGLPRRARSAGASGASARSDGSLGVSPENGGARMSTMLALGGSGTRETTRSLIFAGEGGRRLHPSLELPSSRFLFVFSCLRSSPLLPLGFLTRGYVVPAGAGTQR